MKIVSFLTVAMLVMSSLPARAGMVTYDADATSTFTLVDPGGMGIVFEIMAEPTPTATTGTGLASIDADTHTPATTFAPAVGESVMIESAVSGSADDPSGSSMATVFNGVLVVLTNPSMGAATATFEFSYAWLDEITKTDPTDEIAGASSFFHLTGFAPSGSETLMIDSGAGPMPVGEWLVHPALDSPAGDPGGLISGSETVTALVTLPPESVNSFSVITDAFGFAFTPAPEPMTAGLVLVGFAALTRRRHA